MNNLTQEAHPGPLYRIDISGARHVAAAVLAAESGYCRDYIARLARQRRIAGCQLGRQWYIDERSFWSFFVEQEMQRARRRILLSAERRRERQLASPPTPHE
jgi:hypothetical protein